MEKQAVSTKDLWRPYRSSWEDAAGAPPPTYEASSNDVPPDYTTTDALVYAASLPFADSPNATNGTKPRIQPCIEPSCIPNRTFDVKVDFSGEEGFRTHAGKKAKKAAAAAQKSKWADSDDEDKKKDEGGDGADGGSNGGGDAGGDGGDAGGDDGDDWFGGGGKKKDKKKKKKNAWEVSLWYISRRVVALD